MAPVVDVVADAPAGKVLEIRLPTLTTVLPTSKYVTAKVPA